MSQIHNENIKRPKPKANQLGIKGISSKEFMHFARNSAEGFGSRRECCCDYIFVFENMPEKLLHLSLKSYHNVT